MPRRPATSPRCSARRCSRSTKQAGPEGRLFGSVTPKEIVEAIKDARGVRLERKDVHIEEPIREVGTYTITVDVHDGVTADVKTIVTATE